MGTSQGSPGPSDEARSTSSVRTASGARTYLIGGGAIYLVLFLLGIVGGGDWIPVNDADNWLHLGLGVGMIALGYLTTRESTVTSTA